MIRYYLNTSHDPNDRPDYKYIRVELPINSNLGYKKTRGFENVYLLVSQRIVNNYNDNTCHMTKCVGILANDSVYYDKIKAGMVVVFDFHGEECPLIREDWVINHI
jgi:hypothetical protein